MLNIRQRYPLSERHNNGEISTMTKQTVMKGCWRGRSSQAIDFKRRRLATGLLPLTTLVSTYALAQGELPFPETLEEISVTASRVQRSGFSAPTPTTIVGAEQLQERGVTNVADLLNELPSFAGSVTPSSSNLSSTEAGANFVNLRGLGTSRTLVLVNGRRHVPTTPGGEVDLNAIPMSLVDRIDVVTGGASAAWGSDAVAGVVNIIMKSDVEGLSGDVQYGSSERGDNEDLRAALSFGTRFADDRGHFAIAAEYSDNKGVVDQTDRSWGRERWAVIANPDYAPGNGQPARLIRPGVTIRLASAGGVIIGPPPLAGLAFGPNGSVFNFDYGTLGAGLYQVGGDGGSFGDGLSLKVPVERKNVLSTLSFGLTENVTAYGEASFAISESLSELVNWPDIAAIAISADNAYLPEQVRDIMTTNAIPAFVMGRINDDFGPMITGMKSETWRAVAGLRGSLGGDWKWDVSYQKGQARIDVPLYNNRVQSLFFQAVDAVVDPVSGAIVCRSTLSDPTDGCVPFNVFGQGSTTREAFDYVTRTQRSIAHRTQTVAAASLHGTAFSNWAGPVSVATGIEYREEEIRQRVDEYSAANAFIIGNPQALAGRYDVRELFLESVVPLVAEKPLAHALDLNLAGRLTDYSTSGDVTTWKAGLSWTVNNQLRLRATRSRDIRAPNLPELYTSTKLNFDTVLDPLDGSQYLSQVITRGNLDLKPEKADTTAFGVIYQPAWLPGLRASIDYFDIEINGAIGTLGTQDIIGRCASGSTELCSLITRSPTTNEITSITVTSINLNSLRTRGFDIETSYNFSLPKGDVSLRLLATHVTKKIFDDGQTALNLAGQNGALPEGGVPDWMLTASATYSVGPFSWYLEGRYISAGRFNNTYGPLDIDDNSIPSVVYVNTSARYKIFDRRGQRLELYGVISNLFDKDPPIAPYDFAQPAGTNVGLYDVVGRNFSIGARFGF
jgi:iron complex outermembrane receptor protein